MNTSNSRLLLPEALNFSRFLEQTFEGTVEVTNIKEVRQGFDSRRNRALSLIIGPERFRIRRDEDRFHELRRRFPGIKKHFIGPFYDCLRTNITFRIPETRDLIEHREMLERDGLDTQSIQEIMEDIFTRNTGELRVYPDFIDKKTGQLPIIYEGFRPGVGYPNRVGVDHVRLVYGSYSSLLRLEDYFDCPYSRDIRGPIWQSNEWKRYDEHTEIPFP